MAKFRHRFRCLGWALIMVLVFPSLPALASGLSAPEQSVIRENLSRIELYESDADHASLFPGYSEDEKLLAALLDCYQQAMAATPVPFQYPEHPKDAFELTVCLQMNPNTFFILNNGQRAQLTIAKETILFTKPGDDNFLTITDQALTTKLASQINEVFRAQRVRTMGRLVVEPEKRTVPMGRSFVIKGDMERNNDKMMVFLTPAGTLPDEWSGDFYASIKSTSITDGEIIYPCQEAIFLGQVPVQYGRYHHQFTSCPRLGQRVDGTYGAITPGEWELVVRGGKTSGITIVSTSTLTIVPGYKANSLALVVDGKEVITDVPPELRDNRLFVPVRALAEALDCQMQYQAEQKRILVSQNHGETISLAERPSPDRNQIDQEIILGSPLPIKDGRLLAPVRALSEAFGCKVHWDENNKAVWVNR